MSASSDGAILLTGATGYVGGLVLAGLLANEQCSIVCPIREGRTREQLIESIKAELAAEHVEGEVDFSRLITIALPPISELESLLPLADKLNVAEIIHCAGSVDYFDSARLREANIDMTAKLIFLGQELQVRRFAYMSTAFSSGYTNDLVPEALHCAPDADPTEYTLSKREAERLVAESSLPFLIARPSIVIGDSRDGHYSGKAYGLYQYWTAFEKLLCDRYRSELHYIAPEFKLQVIHQDAFKAAFLAAYRHLPADSIAHMVSRHDALPTVREVVHLFNLGATRARTVHYYGGIGDVPATGIERRVRMWLEFTAVNSEISAHAWRFQTAALDQLKAQGLVMSDATIESIGICQQRFVEQSPRLRAFAEQHKLPPGLAPQVIQSPSVQLALV